ncbi:hypothetical protein [Actinoalloteichus hymeniacidonis]|uniref:Uncharacterized protein n=1 Tax=Actinoalloteichus hymeniacidonis TaxID=340345 RepID=A0AAC9HNS3_9PSEU|nr:hypothetical protein [Actinoalloteichus hymeniacidonis]AOS62166.1 hypothetical protein TL08_06710 [Actinoalloteichus hymeniacidonis]MBB5909811.1 acyl carrier protein [Actinoalloteichus hymeniacidonis]
MISMTVLRSLLAEAGVPGVGEETEEQADELVIDSFALVWFLYVLEERHGVWVDPRDEELTELTSIASLHDYLLRAGRRASEIRAGSGVQSGC